MKRLILCADNRSPYEGEEGCWTYCIPITDVYARLNDIDFKFLKLEEKPDGRHWAWARIPALRKYIQEYDQILWMDSDATILNHSVDVFQAIQTGPESGWRRDSTVTPVCYALVDSPSQDKVCTGIFMLDCRDKQAVADFLNDWWNDAPAASKHAYPWDQTVWNTVWKHDPKKASRIRGTDVKSFQEFSSDQVFIHLIGEYKDVRVQEAKRIYYRLVNKRKQRIGLFVRQQNYYSNGCGQNCIFIKQTLEAAGYDVDLLIQRDPSKSSIVAPNIPYMYTDCKHVDYHNYTYIVYGSAVPSKEECAAIRRAGVKTFMFHPFNSFDGAHNDNFLRSATHPTSVPLFESQFHTFADRVWLLDNHTRSTREYLESINARQPCTMVPISWSPLFCYWNGALPKYVAPPRDSPHILDVVILEPNSAYAKSAWVPIMLCEMLYAQNPAMIRRLHVFNKLRGLDMLKRTALWKDDKIKLYDRTQINELLHHVADKAYFPHHVVFISHQINVPLNYAYFDVCAAGFPFLHNSPDLRDKSVGMYYDDTLLDAAVESLRQVPMPTDAKSYLDTLDPYNPAIVSAFCRALVA